MFIHTDENLYHVAFELERRRGARAITCCKIFLVTTSSGPTLVGRGRTVQGKKDVFNSVTGCRFALKRALADANFTKSVRTLFWKEFGRCHRRVICRAAFTNVGGTFSGKVYEDEARRGERAVKKMLNPTGHGPYAHRRHEYHDGEMLLPKVNVKWSKAEKDEQLRRMYSGDVDYSSLERRILRQIKIINAVTPSDYLKQLLANEQTIRDIIAAKKRRSWLRRVVAKWWSESAAGETPRRGLYKMIQDNYCDECHGRADFLLVGRGGRRCRYCGQKYWINPVTQTAKKLPVHYLHSPFCGD